MKRFICINTSVCSRTIAFMASLVITLLIVGCGNKATPSNSGDSMSIITSDLKKTLKCFDAFQINNGLIVVRSKEIMVDDRGGFYPYGCIDAKGNVVIPMEYDGINVGNGVILVSKFNKNNNQVVMYGLVDFQGREILPCEYEEIFWPDVSSKRGYIRLRKNGLYGCVDKKGNLMIPIQYESLYPFFEDDAYRFYKEENIPDVYIAIRNGEQQIINLSPEKIKNKPSMPYDVRIIGEYGNQSFMNYQGHIVAGPFQNVRDRMPLFSEGLAAVVNNNKVGFIDMQGVMKIPYKFDYSEYRFNFHSLSFGIFREGLAAMMRNGKWGYIDNIGNTVIPFQYDGAYCFNQGAAVVVKQIGNELKAGLIDKNNAVVLPFEFEGGYSSGDVFVMWKDGLYGVYSPSGVCIAPCQYEPLISFFAGYAAVGFNGKEGLMNEQGRLVIPCEYDALLYDGLSNLVWVKKNGKMGYINLQNQIVVPIVYDAVERIKDDSNLFSVCKDGRYGLFDLYGNCTLE